MLSSQIRARSIIHRDLKPTNIFLDAHGDVRIGDFGLAVEQTAPVEDTSDTRANRDADASDLTSDVGTGLYVAPEMASRGAGAKANGQQQSYTNKACNRCSLRYCPTS